jgi:erythromycin esterase-like protein
MVSRSRTRDERVGAMHDRNGTIQRGGMTDAAPVPMAQLVGDAVRTDAELVEALRERATTLRTADDLEPLVDLFADARIVLLGEATHGTLEFYGWRARLSARLIADRGFSFVAVEGDWPDCYEVNRYVRAYPGAARTAKDALRGFTRWPTWMWGNWEVVAFAEWLRQWNDERAAGTRAGFYGLDVYSLFESMDAVMAYLRRVDPGAAEEAKRAYLCFEPYLREPQDYARATALVPTSCEDEVIDVLVRLRRDAARYPDDEERFNAMQNAIVAVEAERYYRAMVRTDAGSWNVRDRHMTNTLGRLLERRPGAKGIVWAHNTHVGDARATDMATAGMVNVGQLARERWGGEVVAVGFSTYAGGVIAGREWGAPMERMPVPAARSGSVDAALHEATEASDAIVVLRDADGALKQRYGHRAIGVVYDPRREGWGNYVPSRLALRYDALVHIDRSRALRPLGLPPEPSGEPPETYPWGF